LFGFTSLLFDNFSELIILSALSDKAGQTNNKSKLIGLSCPFVSLCLAACVLAALNAKLDNVG
jgi:hypothetical protein